MGKKNSSKGSGQSSAGQAPKQKKSKPDSSKKPKYLFIKASKAYLTDGKVPERGLC